MPWTIILQVWLVIIRMRSDGMCVCTMLAMCTLSTDGQDSPGIFRLFPVEVFVPELLTHCLHYNYTGSFLNSCVM